ncbi:L-2-hydroxyglutarate dehydrogenase, mitochondrial [Cytospora mali]|uniref:L-2-hydroxyglutarate dehydrogenase, mitochondrial n=1 Tax=Cytospora mali TaxID=578113 RepID=A0A194UTI5_CYTMA|nr:L-2-hydroxyglutarate dehydrogenase, mitochondrial [Valsa mali var. pyri (nom. inval.)]
MGKSWPVGAGSSNSNSSHIVSSRLFSTSAARQVDFSHVVIGGGVVGLAISRALTQRTPSVLLLERHLAPGTETSSRNSEVIHAGIYYGADTLKTRLCIRGKDLLYEYCAAWDVPHRNTGKWIVAQNKAQRGALEGVYRHCVETLGGRVPVRWVGKDEMQRREPDVRAETGCLESPTTGIVDSHSLMVTLLGHFEEAGGTFSPGSNVTAITPLGGGSGSGGAPGSGGWEVTVRDVQSGEESSISAETIVNAAGLGSCAVNNMIVPAEQHRKMYYAKGNYFSYTASRPRVGTLIYPAPEPGHGGLGTHLTMDMGGRVKFGPDVEWVDSADDLAVNGSRMAAATEEIKRYLPGIDVTALAPDYAGIRPKLAAGQAVMGGKGFNDFVIRKEEGYEGWVNLLGIESPGLTSSLAIGEMVEGLLYK